jgi:hypothetical protein
LKIITGNDLKSGAVIWWAGDGWSPHVEDSVDVGETGDTLLARETAALRVNGGYVVEATATADGVRPAHIKERIRALGPTVRLDLSLKPADPDAGEWVI